MRRCPAGSGVCNDQLWDALTKWNSFFVPEHAIRHSHDGTFIRHHAHHLHYSAQLFFQLWEEEKGDFLISY